MSPPLVLSQQTSIPPRGLGWQALYSSGSLGTQVVFSVVPAFLPITLEQQFASSPMAIGVILAFAPAAGLLAVPAANALIMPAQRRFALLLAGLTSALALACLPLSLNLWQVAAAVGLTYMALNVFLGPYRASTRDEVVDADVLRVSGMQTAFKALGTLLVLAGGGVLYLKQTATPFWGCAALLLGTTLATVWAMGRGQRPALSPAGLPPSPLPLGEGVPIQDVLRVRRWLGGLRDLRNAGRGLEWLLLAHGCWWYAFHGIFAFTIPFMALDLATEPGIPVANTIGAAIPILTTFAAVGMLASFPVAAIAERWGKVPILLVGLLASIVGTLSAVFARDATMGYVFALTGGLGFACIQALPYPLMLEHSRATQDSGLATLFETAIDASQLVAVVSLGAMAAAAGSYRVVFVAATTALLLACLFLALGARLPAPEQAITQRGGLA